MHETSVNMIGQGAFGKGIRKMFDVTGQKLRLAADEELDAICRHEISVKNAVYRFVNQNKVLERGQMERLLSAEKASYGKRLLILGILQHYEWDNEKAEEYLASKSAIVRYHVLLYRYEREKRAWAGLEKMLLDSSRRIRENAAYILVKRKGMDVTSYYHTRFHTVHSVCIMVLWKAGRRLRGNVF